MLALHPQFIIDEAQHKKAVILPIKEWQKLMEEVEELDAIRAYDNAKADTDDEVISFDQALDQIARGSL